jgi:hypothetical protein
VPSCNSVPSQSDFDLVHWTGRHIGKGSQVGSMNARMGIVFSKCVKTRNSGCSKDGREG